MSLRDCALARESRKRDSLLCSTYNQKVYKNAAGKGLNLHQVKIKIGKHRLLVRHNPQHSDAAGKKAEQIIGDKGNRDIKKSCLISIHNAPAGGHYLLDRIRWKVQHDIICL